MEKTLKLIGNLAHVNSEPFIVTDNEALTFKIETEVPINTLVVVFRNATVEKTMRYEKPKSFTVPKEVLFGGDLDMVLTHYKNGNIIKEWTLKPLTILEKSVGWEVLDTFRAEYKQLSETYKLINTQLKAMLESQSTVSDNIAAIAKATTTNSTNIVELAELIKKIQN